MPWGLYVHIPFCPYKCDYCDFVAVTAGPRLAPWMRGYAAMLEAEADFWRGVLDPAPPISVFYGGGTPTLLADLAGLHRRLARRFGLPPGAEVTVECNPGTVGDAELAALRAAGVNRLSIGLQAAQDGLLEGLGRQHTWTQFAAAFGAARAAGFANIAVDVMCGLPGQTLEDALQTIDRVLALGPEHLSAYSLQVEEGTVLERRAARSPGILPPDDLVVAQLAGIRAALLAAGFEHYEISNFARPERRCRHNLLYWRNDDYLGLGIGAHAHWRGRRWENTRRLAVYRDALRAGDGGWVHGSEEPDAARERGDAAFLELRLLEGIDLEGYRTRHGVSLEEAFPGVPERLVADGLCALEGGRLRLRPDALPVANRAFVAFV